MRMADLDVCIFYLINPREDDPRVSTRNVMEEFVVE